MIGEKFKKFDHWKFIILVCYDICKITLFQCRMHAWILVSLHRHRHSSQEGTSSSWVTLTCSRLYKLLGTLHHLNIVEFHTVVSLASVEVSPVNSVRSKILHGLICSCMCSSGEWVFLNFIKLVSNPENLTCRLMTWPIINLSDRLCDNLAPFDCT